MQKYSKVQFLYFQAEVQKLGVKYHLISIVIISQVEQQQ